MKEITASRLELFFSKEKNDLIAAVGKGFLTWEELDQAVEDAVVNHSQLAITNILEAISHDGMDDLPEVVAPVKKTKKDNKNV